MIDKFTHLDEETQMNIQKFINSVIKIASDKLLSIIMYGNATQEDFDVKTSSINFLIILTDIDSKFLTDFAITSNEISQNISVPLFLTPSDIHSSVNILPLEFLTLKESYIIIYGDDYLNKIKINIEDLRVELSQEIKRRLIKLREEFIDSFAKKPNLERLLTTSLISFIPLFRNTVRLIRKETPVSGTPFREFCETFDLSQDPFFYIWDIKMGNKRADKKKLVSLFGDYLTQINNLSKKIDKYIESGQIT